MSVAMQTARMNLRIDPDTAARIRRAAEVAGVSTSVFVARAAAAAADQVLADRREFHLDAKRWQQFVDELDRPARELPELRRGLELRERLVGS
jgi:uncharacterized protein (DUF1778 family)